MNKKEKEKRKEKLANAHLRLCLSRARIASTFRPATRTRTCLISLSFYPIFYLFPPTAQLGPTPWRPVRDGPGDCRI